MNVPKIGQLITLHEQRDAIHLAVLPVTATEMLRPGTPVCLAIDGNSELVIGCLRDHPKCIGIIDPFLITHVHKDEHCWVFLTPNTITGLRHEWVHPLIDGNDRKAISEFWLRDFAHGIPMHYDDLMSQLSAHGQVAIGEDLNYENLTDENIELLKEHFLVVTGIQLADPGFRCAC